MTTIAGIMWMNNVVMACDSLVTDGDYSYDCFSPCKIIEYTDWMIGVAGGVRLNQIIQSTEFPEFIPDTHIPYDWFITEFIPELRSALKENGDLCVNEVGQEYMDGELLVGFPGVLFRVHKFFSVLDPQRVFDAIGSGEHVALGVLAGEYIGKTISNEVDAETILKTTIHICKQHDPKTGGSIHVKKRSYQPFMARPEEWDSPY